MTTRSRRNRFYVAAAAVAALAGAGCQHNASTGPAPTPNTLRVAMLASPATLDPAMVQDGTTIDLIIQVYGGLVQWTKDNKIAPDLATKWEVSKDGKTYTFHLRDGVQFHSGAPVTADDVVYSLTRCLDPKLASPVAMTYLGDIVGAADVNAGKTKILSGVKAIDPRTVRITIAKPKAYWINVLTYPTAFIVNKKAVTTDPDGKITDKNTDGTGPFKMAAFNAGQSVSLTANAKYWDGAPTIDGQQRLILTNSETRHNLYLSGQLDIVDESAASLGTDDADASLRGQIQYFPRAATYYLALNQSDTAKFAPFKDVRVRQAFAYATDKKRLVSLVFNGHRHVAEDILPEGIVGFDPQFKGIPYDPEKAKALMAAAGYPGGKGFPNVPISFRESYPDLKKTVDLLAHMYHDTLGVTVEQQQTEWGALLDAEDKGSLPSYHIRWSADYLDPQDFYTILLHTGSSENKIGYSNPKVDALLDSADIEQNAAKRMAGYHQAARIAADEVPRIPLYYQQDVELVKPNVSGLEDCLMYHLPYKHIRLK